MDIVRSADIRYQEIIRNNEKIANLGDKYLTHNGVTKFDIFFNNFN
jgi:hypothetical protein